MPRPLLNSALSLAFTCASLLACAPPAPQHGTRLEPPFPRPSFTLTDTRGQPFEFQRETRGRLTFLFFGYCPVHVANVAAVLHKLPFEDQQRATFVFVSIDPARDSLPVLRAWLDHFDKNFIGLRGDLDTVNGIMASVGLPPAIIGPATGPKGFYEVAHAAAVLVYTADDSAHVAYPFGTRQLDWAEDIPRLLKIGRKE